jgi:hypothetical protein
MSHDSFVGTITGVIALAITAPIGMTLFFKKMRGGGSRPPEDRDKDE